jgi:hypothetical protein
MSDALVRITTMAALLVGAIERVAKADAELKAAKETQRRLEQDDLPELMRELTLTEIKLADGSAVTVVNEVDCSITEERRPAAHAWLEEHGFGGLIKTAVTVDFARDEREAAAQCAVQIEETLGRPAQVGERVHPATLKAFVKEQLAAGAGVPFDLFGVRPYAKAKITAPRAK